MAPAVRKRAAEQQVLEDRRAASPELLVGHLRVLQAHGVGIGRVAIPGASEHGEVCVAEHGAVAVVIGGVVARRQSHQAGDLFHGRIGDPQLRELGAATWALRSSLSGAIGA